jgi:hypothetical protein
MLPLLFGQVESLMQSFVAIQDTKDIVGAMSGVFTEGWCACARLGVPVPCCFVIAFVIIASE